MATFEVQIEGLTGLTITGSSSPTQDEVTEFLKDGINDVTNKCIQLKPQDKELFQRESSTIANNGDFEVKGADIISVIREANADGSSDGSTVWRNCRKIPAHMQSRVVDPDSLHFASIYNPVYTIIDYNKVHVYPTPDGTNDGFKVYYVNNDPTPQTGGSDITYAMSTIKYFPDNKVYLVVLYASIKSLENAMSAKTTPGVESDSDGIELTTMVSLDAENTIDDFDGNAIEFDQWFATATHLLEDEEDTELAAAQLQKIGAYINAYQAQLQGNTTNYQWMQSRHQILSQQYERAFAMMAPPQPQQAAGGRR